jgi:hypothetical protein
MTLIAIYYQQILWGSMFTCAIAMSLALWATAIKKDTLANILLGIAIIVLFIYAFISYLDRSNPRLLLCIVLGIMEGCIFDIIKRNKAKGE